MDRLLGGEQAELLHILNFLDHLLGGFTAKTTPEFQRRVALPDRLLGGTEA